MVSLSTAMGLHNAFLHFLAINKYWQIAAATSNEAFNGADVTHRTLFNDKTKSVTGQGQIQSKMQCSTSIE